MVVFYVLQRLSGDWFVVTSLLLGGFYGGPVVNFPWIMRIIEFLFALLLLNLDLKP